MVWKEILEVRWKAGIALLVFITKAAAVTLIIALVLAIPGWFESISRFSIYNHMQNFESFQSGTLPWADVAFLVAAFVALTGATYALFRTKEF